LKISELDDKEREIAELRNYLRVHRAALQKLKNEKDSTLSNRIIEFQEIENNRKQEEEALQSALQKNKELEDRREFKDCSVDSL
jgi:hypothetical protein